MTNIGRRVVNRIKRGVHDSRVYSIKRVWRKPVWYTDKHALRMIVYPTDDLSDLFYRNQHFDDDGFSAYCSRILKPGMTVLDVGANYGQFALTVARHIGPTGRIHSFEPTATSFERLSINLQAQKEMQGVFIPQRLAVSNQVGEVEFYLYPEEHSAWNSLGAHQMWNDWDARGNEAKAILPTSVEKIQCVTLDAYCRTSGIEHVDLLKIDVEGFEVEVLQGAMDLIKNRRVMSVIFEISLDPLSGTGRTAGEVLTIIEAMGMELSLIDPQGTPVPIDVSTFQAPYIGNYLARPV